jgi:RNA polymerase sigma factor (sigma-70 family)
MDALSDVEIVALVERELASRGWALASEPSLFAPGESFAGRVLARVAQWATEKPLPRDADLVRKACVHEYCRLLHAAVSLHGSRVQEIALQETLNRGWPIALRELGDRQRAEDAVLRAVTAMWRAAGHIDPGAYLAYFGKVLRNEIYQERRKQGRTHAHEEPLDAPGPHDEGSPRDDDTPDPGALDPALAVEIEEARAEFWQALSDCLGNARREYILITNVIFGFNGSEIARQLKTTVAAVHMAKHQAIQHIKQRCAGLLARLLGELSALRAESAGRA